MTEKPPSLSTQIAAPSQTTSFNPGSTIVSSRHVPSKVETAEEEPYTIKCICNFSDDDGNTIYCDTCDTWQHIECFYPYNIQDAYREDFAHSCADCKPRPLDRLKAVERQRLRRTTSNVEEEAPERKPKRPPSKSHKKRTKPSELQLNGHAVSDASKPSHSHDGVHQHKKSKSTHKASHSISSQAAKRSPSYGNNSTKGNHPPSPATTPPDLPGDFEFHNYSTGFLSLYSDDQDVKIVPDNFFASLMISNAISLWTRDHDKLKQETGKNFDEVFQPLPSDIDSIRKPVHVQHKELTVAPNTVAHWQFLNTPSAIDKDIPLIELNGQIGFQKDYCQDPENRWDDLSSPLPFVFFHPQLPLYIDTRKEGSQARYVRRSCKPNVSLDTYLSAGSEYHFWLVSDRDIAPNEQITLPWDLRLPKSNEERWLHALGLADEEPNGHAEHDVDEEEYQQIAGWVSNLLSEYGGCACDLGNDCAFVRFHRNYLSKSHPRQNLTKKRSRKPKTHTISPTSTGHATNSRAPSEGQGDEGADRDERANSVSSHGKPQSRDMTPARQGSFDQLGILTEPTDRDKRKVAMVEDSFRRMEQQQPPRKKKRVSDGAGSKVKVRNAVGSNGTSERRYVDAGTSRSLSGSPSSAVSPNTANPTKNPPYRQGSAPSTSRQASVGPRPEYCDAGVQTDPVEGEWYSPSKSTLKLKRRVISLSKRLLDNRHRSRLEDEEKRRRISLSQEAVALAKMELDSPTATILASPPGTDPIRRASVVAPDQSVDATMTDIGAVSPPDVKVALPSAPLNPIKTKSPELRVQLPPVPAFNTAPTASPATTPLSATGSILHSPFSANNLASPFAPPAVNGVAAHPSPVKKKLSLSDYTKMKKAAAAKPSLTSLKPPTPADEAKSPTSLEGSNIIDSPTAEKTEP